MLSFKLDEGREPSSRIAGCATSLDHMPELWIDILKRLPTADRLRHAPLVCHSFSVACRDPSMWSELRILDAAFPTEARWSAFLQWLAARASGLQTFAFGGDWDIEDSPTWGKRTPELIMLLSHSATQLRSLDHRYPRTAPMNAAAALPAALGRLSQLTSLSLDLGRAPVTTTQVDAMLQTLPLLQHLALGCNKALLRFPLSITRCCSLLQDLSICDSVGLGGMNARLGAVPSELGSLVGLTRLHLVNVSVSSLPDSISQLTALRELNIEGNAEPVIPNGLFSLTGLTKLTLGDSMDYSLSGSVSQLIGLLDLSIKCERYTELPAGLTACRQLSRLEVASDQGSPVVAHLPALRHLCIRILPNRLPHVDFWTSLTALCELELQCTRGHSCRIDVLDKMVSLRRLTMTDASLCDIPMGRYLGQLESLRLVRCYNYIHILDYLKFAKKLRNLDFDDMRLHFERPFVRALSSMPVLVNLRVKRPATIHQVAWTAGLALLTAQCRAKGHGPLAVHVY